MIAYHRLLGLALFAGTSMLVLTAVISACHEAAEQRHRLQQWSSGAQAAWGLTASNKVAGSPDRLAPPPPRIVSSNCPAGKVHDSAGPTP